VVLLEAGDRVPADLRLVRCRGLRIDEAALTGESVPVDKDSRAVAADAPLAERVSMAYSGTIVAAGQARGIAVATGGGTELGRISALIGAVAPATTPLVRQMEGFARHLTVAILGLSAAALAFVLLVRGWAFDEAFMAVVGLAVAAIPEGLPAIVTITLAIGVQRMARRRAIIRKLPAVETLGSVSVICSDKTGTLTRNQMTAASLVTPSGVIEVSGAGYTPVGGFTRDGRPVDPRAEPGSAALIEAAVLCNDGELRRTGDEWSVFGDPMEGALLVLAAKAGIDPADLRLLRPRCDEIPFDSRSRFMATLHGHEGGDARESGPVILLKGAPERILSMCDRLAHPAGDRPLDRARWHALAEELAARGQRVLAFARKPGAEDILLDAEDVEGGAALVGLIGFIDPPRDEAVAAVADCRRAGIRVVMITGDHAATARAIARQLDPAADPKVATGLDLDGLDEAAMRRVAREVDVFARTTPEHKLQLVRALQAEGLVVAMTGDGVNDAPALKRADVGVAMGNKGTEAAKEAAEMVLADDDFASIVAAVREGRTVYDNIVKTIAWTMPTNAGEAATILTAMAFGLALPITPVQILWVNMVTAVTLGLTLAFEPIEAGTMRRPPRPAGRPLLTPELVWRILFVALLFVAGAFGIFDWALRRGLSLETARTLVVDTLVVMEIAYLFAVRYVHGGSLTFQGVLGTPAVWLGVSIVVVAQLAFTYAPFMQVVFDTRPVGLLEGAVVLAIGVVLLLVVEVEKGLRRRLRHAG